MLIHVENLSKGIVKLTLNRPQNLNALNEEVLHQLEAELTKIAEDDNARGVILTGEGSKAFCAGADIHRLAELNAVQGLAFAQQGQRIFRKFETLKKPSIAAINGYAFGGGCEIAMCTSLRICSENAVFGQPEVKLGVIPGYGGTQRLARLVGKGRAMDLCITGRSIDAATALAWGLVSEVVPLADLLQRAEAIVSGILELAPLAVQGCLEVVDRGYDLTLDDALAFEAERFAVLCATEDKHEGVAAFLNKRKASFKDNNNVARSSRSFS